MDLSVKGLSVGPAGKIYCVKTAFFGFFTNDLIYDVLCGLLGGESDSFYQSRLDISSPDYAINKDNALTLHGKRHVLEDPTLAEK